MEDMLNSSDTSRNRVATTFNDDSDSEERYEEPLMEEISDDDLDDCNFIIPQPKYNNKRHKLAATRDFPDGCGPYASRIDVPDNSFDETIQSSLEDAEVTTTRTAKVVKCEQNAVTRKRKWKNRNYKWKCFYCVRVPAVRDLPPLCGGNGSDLISEGESLEKGLVENCVEGDDDDVVEKEEEVDDVIGSYIANSESEESN